MQFTFSTDDPAEAATILEALSGTPATKPAPAKKAPAKPAPKDDAPADEPSTDGPTLEDAVATATKMVSNGESAKVKTALAAVGAKRVSEVSEDKVAEFLDALNA